MSKKNYAPLPLTSEKMMFDKSLLNNSGLSVTNNYIASFYRLYFYDKIYSIMQIKGLPKSIKERYFKNVLLTRGFLGIFDTKEYGIICNHVALSDYDIYYDPTKMMSVGNKLRHVYKRSIIDSVGSDISDNIPRYEAGVLVKLSPNFETVLPIVYYFADLMAVAVQGLDSNVLNSKLAYIFACDDQKKAESFKKMHEEIANGEPAVFADKKLFDDDGKLKVELFNKSVKDTYMADKFLQLKTEIENDFNSFIGLTVVNTEKKERLITPEIELSNNNNKLIIELWQKEVNRCLEIANNTFGLNMKLELNLNAIDDKRDRGVEKENVSTESNTDI